MAATVHHDWGESDTTVITHRGSTAQAILFLPNGEVADGLVSLQDKQAMAHT